MKRNFKISVAVAVALSAPVVAHLPAAAQSNVQSGSADLQDALRRIALNSKDSSALADAGLAALALGDTRAAIGFLAKADQIYPKSGRVKAGLGKALLAEQNPFGAVHYFTQAVANGIAPREIAADRGLAYDLIGRNRDAQKDYELALRYGRNDQLIARYAVSLGISGDLALAEEQLNPLLQKSDRDAWRNRAFIFAMNGKKKDANEIAEQTMERRMAKAIKPFFGRMSQLTAAQKAAAVHFGHFPASENIGVDVAAVKLASNLAVRGRDRADAGLIPVGDALGADVERPRVLAMPDRSPRRRPGAADRRMPHRKTTRRVERNEVVALARTDLPAPSESIVEPTPVIAPAVSPQKSPPVVKPDIKNSSPGFATTLGTGQAPELVSQTVERKVEIAGRKPVSPASAETKVDTPVNLIDFDLASADSSETKMASAPDARPLSDIIRGISIPEQETKTKVVPVNLNEIEPAKPQPKIAPKPVEKKPVHPKRYWVQIATGSNLDALKFDYRRMAKKQADLFKGQKGWTSRWGKARRLVVGPFEDFKAAKAFEASFRKGGGDGFAWASADGVEVNELTK
ncbi:SPOR domain-containing protein [Parasphingorhabdus sp.]|uniref:SPOR domain-containing protein n=1 Tax=Parasphingorhabdus sp. TaxID=2709688 RepID=UPI0032666644